MIKTNIIFFEIIFILPVNFYILGNERKKVTELL